MRPGCDTQHLCRTLGSGEFDTDDSSPGAPGGQPKLIGKPMSQWETYFKNKVDGSRETERERLTSGHWSTLYSHLEDLETSQQHWPAALLNPVSWQKYFPVIIWEMLPTKNPSCSRGHRKWPPETSVCEVLPCDAAWNHKVWMLTEGLDGSSVWQIYPHKQLRALGKLLFKDLFTPLMPSSLAGINLYNNSSFD